MNNIHYCNGPIIREQAHWIDDYSHVEILIKNPPISYGVRLCVRVYKKLTRSLRTSLDKS